MTLTQLEYVVAVYKHKHFGKAAQSCFVTQPTLSMQLQKLEEELEVTIFDRSKTPVQPTSEGMAVIEQAQIILREQKKLISILNESKEEVSGDFKLAVIPTLSPYVVPSFVHEFQKIYPKVNLQITEEQTDQIIEMLKNDEIDAAVLVTPLHEPTIVEKVLYYEPFYLFVHPDHPLSKKKKIREEDLDINEIWLLNKGNCFREQVLNICAKSKNEKIRGPVNFESGNLETLKNMVLTGTGYTVLPEMAAQQLTGKQKNMLRPFQKPIPTREVSFVHSKNSIKQKLLDVVEQELLANVPDELREFKRTQQEVIEIS